MKIRIIYNFKLIPPAFGAITLYPFIFVRADKIQKTMLKHEFIHVGQIKREGIIRFYFNYLMEFIRNYFKYRDWNKAYFNIPYEIEAYSKQDHPITAEEMSWLT